MEGHESVTAVIFGLDPFWVSTVILILTYVVLLSERYHRTVVALLGAGIVVMTGVLNQELAFSGIDFNTIALLTGMMIIVAVTRLTGVFEFVAIWSAQLVKADPFGVLLVLSIVTAVFSAFLDNLTTVLLVVPIALLIVEKLKVSPYPFLVSQILASNVGGTATLIGDPPNILIGSATGYSFNAFLFELGPIALFILFIMLGFLYLMWGKGMTATDEQRARVMAFHAKDSITDYKLMYQCLFVLGLVIFGFVVGEHYGLRPGTTAMFCAALLLFITSIGEGHGGQASRLRDALGEVEWGALFFFMGLFVVVKGVEHGEVLSYLGNKLIAATGGDVMVTTFSVLWVSAIVSAAIDNIPFVATMIPLVQGLEGALGGPAGVEPVWWALALGACLGGNGSLIGAAANVMVAGLAERSNHSISFVSYLKIGLPFMLVTIVIANAYMYLRHFM